MSWDDDPWKRFERERERRMWDPWYRYEYERDRMQWDSWYRHMKEQDRMSWDPYYRYMKEREREHWDPFYRHMKEQQRLYEDPWYRQVQSMSSLDQYSTYGTHSGLGYVYRGMGEHRREDEQRNGKRSWFSKLLRKLFWFRYEDAPLW